MVGTYNKVFFGYLSFLYPFLLIAFTIFVYKNHGTELTRMPIILPTFLIILSVTLFQAYVVESDYNGYIGWYIVRFLDGYIGGVGIWIFIVALFALGLILLNEIIYFKVPQFEFNFSNPFNGIKQQFNDFLDDGSSEELYIPNSYEQQSQPIPIKQEKPKIVPKPKVSFNENEPEILSLPDSIDSLFGSQEEDDIVISPVLEEHKKIDNIIEESKELEVKEPPKKVHKVVKELAENKELLDKIEKVKRGKIKNLKTLNFHILIF